MADPILDEDYIEALLNCEAKTENVTRLQAGAVQALLDIYDRKVTRDQFVDLVSPCIALYGQSAKLWLLRNIRGVFDEGDLDAAKLDEARVGIEGIIAKQRDTVIEIVGKLRACPTSRDVVH